MFVATEQEMQSLSLRVATTNDPEARMKFYHEIITGDPHNFNSLRIPFRSVVKGSVRVCTRRTYPVYALVPKELYDKILSIPLEYRAQSQPLRKMVFDLYDQVCDYMVAQKAKHEN
jgi:hypothetical protein